MIRLGKQSSGDLNCGDEEFFQVCTGLDATMYRRAMKLEGNRNRNFENFPIGEIQNFEKRKIRFARSRDRATFRRRVLRTFKRCLRHVGGSRASALLSLRSSLSPVLAVAYPWYTCPTPGVSRGEPQRAEGQSRHARDAHNACEAAAVGAEPQRSAEKTRSRAGSPTRATRHSASLQAILNADPALP